MGDLAADTALEAVDGGVYRARISPEWELFSPAGGYVSALALRAATSTSAFSRPVAYTCHYLNPARTGEAELRVTSLRSSRRAESLQVQLLQEDRTVLQALVWTSSGAPGVDHDTVEMPDAAPPEQCAPMEDLVPDWPPWPFWKNIDYRPVLLPGQEPYVPGRAALRTWMRFRPQAAFAEPALAAARSLIVADVLVYPAASMAHPWPTPFWATSLDLAVTIHDPGLEDEWLLVHAEAPTAAAGLIGGRVTVWGRSGRELASSVQQMLQLPASQPR